VIVTDDTDTYVIFNYQKIDSTRDLYAQVVTNNTFDFLKRIMTSLNNTDVY